ncbi:MAG TPA: ABC transporter permease [Thermoanaerobaculia bacterium]|nr:ABC transporter permease [Thermoanaerobaculia bacterium]
MSAQALAPRRSLARILALEARCELLKLVRLPAYALPTLGFPLVFYLLFGVAMNKRPGFDIAAYLLATYGVFGVVGASLFGFGVGVAIERGQGWMLFKRATPMPPLAWVAGRLCTSLAFGAVLVALLFLLGATAGKVELPVTTWLSLAGVLIAGMVPFAAFGLALGYLAGPNSAPAVVNLIYLPMAIASGLWMPIDFMPKVFQQIAPWLPTYHFSQLALGVIGMGRGEPVFQGVVMLVGFTVVSLALAWVGYRRDEGKTVG